MIDYVRDGAEIYRRSFATIRAEADLDRLPPDLARVAVRMIHACGMVDDLAFVGVTACTGRPGCAKALADVRVDALAMIASGARVGRPVHWSGCARRCGRPRGEVVDVVATEDGYTVRRASE